MLSSGDACARFASAVRDMAVGVDVHCHINGCVRDDTLLELASARGLGEEARALVLDAPRDLMSCFEIFKLIHEVCTTHEAVRRIAREVVMDFAADGALYVELRTTPKNAPERGVTKDSYVEAVLDGIEDACGVGGGDGTGKITARVILSIDRGRDDTAAKINETIELALRNRHRGVVGIDVSGDPKAGSWDMYEPALQRARDAGLGIAVHCGEVANTEDEQRQIISWAPDRLGHCVFTVHDAACYDALRASHIPVELCLTSNVFTKSNESYASHHFKILRRDAVPLCICTDDTWVFRTTLSRECAIAHTHFGLTLEDIRSIMADAVRFSFVETPVKTKLLARIQGDTAS